MIARLAQNYSVLLQIFNEVGNIFMLLSGKGLRFNFQLFNVNVLCNDLTSLGIFIVHQENMSVKCIPPRTPLLNSKTGVCEGISIFLIFAPKHRLWVLVRTASAIYVLSKNEKKYPKISTENFNFNNLRKIYILHGCVFVMRYGSHIYDIKLKISQLWRMKITHACF